MSRYDYERDTADEKMAPWSIPVRSAGIASYNPTDSAEAMAVWQERRRAVEAMRLRPQRVRVKAGSVPLMVHMPPRGNSWDVT